MFAIIVRGTIIEWNASEKFISDQSKPLSKQICAISKHTYKQWWQHYQHVVMVFVWKINFFYGTIKFLKIVCPISYACVLHSNRKQISLINVHIVNNKLSHEWKTKTIAVIIIPLLLRTNCHSLLLWTNDPSRVGATPIRFCGLMLHITDLHCNSLRNFAWKKNLQAYVIFTNQERTEYFYYQ